MKMGPFIRAVVVPYYEAWARPTITADFHEPFLAFDVEQARVSVDQSRPRIIAELTRPYHHHFINLSDLIQPRHVSTQSQSTWLKRAQHSVGDLKDQLEKAEGLTHDPDKVGAFRESARVFVAGFRTEQELAIQRLSQVEQMLDEVEETLSGLLAP